MGEGERNKKIISLFMAGVVYCKDAYGEGLTIVDYAIADMCGQVIYPGAIMKNSKVSKEYSIA